MGFRKLGDLELETVDNGFKVRDLCVGSGKCGLATSMFSSGGIELGSHFR